jgi:hypothetical protein
MGCDSGNSVGCRLWGPVLRWGGSGFGVLAGFLGVWGWCWWWICGVGWGRVLFSESPPLMRENSDKPPLFNSLRMAHFYVCRVRVGPVCGSWNPRKR